MTKITSSQISLTARKMVEVVGFEPTAFWSRTKRATRLRYTSKKRADKGTRTLDLMITNQPLYQLSYIGTPTNCQHRILYQRKSQLSIISFGRGGAYA